MFRIIWVSVQPYYQTVSTWQCCKMLVICPGLICSHTILQLYYSKHKSLPETLVSLYGKLDGVSVIFGILRHLLCLPNGYESLSVNINISEGQTCTSGACLFHLRSARTNFIFFSIVVVTNLIQISDCEVIRTVLDIPVVKRVGQSKLLILFLLHRCNFTSYYFLLEIGQPSDFFPETPVRIKVSLGLLQKGVYKTCL